VAPATSGTKRRRWKRLAVTIPVFIRGVDERGRDFLDLSAAVNISAGGALLVSRRFLPSDSRVSVEIPAPPLPKHHFKAQRLKARVVQVRSGDGYHLCGLAFSRPLALH
jgi:hypothetical protein